MVSTEAIPVELKERVQWVVWRRVERIADKPTKVLYNAKTGAPASSTDESTWSTFTAALHAYETSQTVSRRPWDGIGFVVTAEDEFIGVDLDHCFEDGQLKHWAKSVVKQLDSYTEVSPSGEGLRVFLRGTLPPGRRKIVLDERTREAVEMYETGRFLTVTGDVVLERAVNERTAQIAAVHARVFPPERPVRPSNPPAQTARLDDAELLAKMRAAKNGDAVWSLWQGDSSGYGSQSEADLALCSHLAFWTGGQRAEVDRLFRQSGLYRDKWDERRGDQTYGAMTVERALAGMTDFYDPQQTDNGIRIRLKAAPGATTDDETIDDLPDTDYGNARRLVARYGAALRYCHPWSKWLAWDGARWRLDDTGAVVRFAKQTVRLIYAEAADAAAQDRAKALAKWAGRSQAGARLRDMVSLAESEPGVPVIPEHLDADPWLLCTQSGVVDLRTGGLQPHDRELLITKLVPVAYDPAATCPAWEAFLDRIMGGDQTRVTFLQRAIGYSLTGRTAERVLFVLWGVGSNGKSTLLELLADLLGDYAMKTPTETLLAQRSNGIPNDVARLKGARFVHASEADEGRRLAEALVKAMTGGDTLSARFMRGEFFDFRPEFKLWLSTNHKPVIKGTDQGIWDRIRLIPFEVRFERGLPADQGGMDLDLPRKLRAELPGILAWAVRGCLDWQRLGLGLPEAVRDATAAYRAEMDVLTTFLRDVCWVDPQAQATAKALYGAYKNWCEETGEHAMSQRAFGSHLGERGFQNRRAGANGSYVWFGIGLRTAEDMPNAGSGSFSTEGKTELLNSPELISTIHLKETRSIQRNREIGSESLSGSETLSEPPEPAQNDHVTVSAPAVCGTCRSPLLPAEVPFGVCFACDPAGAGA